MAITSYKDIISNKFNLAPSQLMTFTIPNKNTKFLRDLLDRNLTFSDNGTEVGSINYISKSPKYFIRAKALQKESFLPFLTEETTIPIRPQVFVDYNLKEGDILISKDSNIGEVVILDKDLPNHTISGALYKLPITKNKYYILAFLKHNHFRKQLDLLVPKGSTIRHAKTLFLDCKIPFPNQKNRDEVILYVELLMQAIINKEKEIRNKHQQILQKTEKELLENQKYNKFEFNQAKFTDLKKYLRLDVGLYGIKYKEIDFLIKNYKNGFSNIETDLNFKTKRGTNLAISVIGRSIYSKNKRKNFYTLVTSADLSDFGLIKEYRFLGNPKKLVSINYGDIMFSATGQAHTSIGKTHVFIYPPIKLTSNFNSFFFYKKDFNLIENIFIAMFFMFLKQKGYFVEIIGRGNGGSFTEKHFPFVNIPNFPKNKQKEIAFSYHNPVEYPKNLNLKNFLEEDKKWNKKAGIIEIDKSMKQLKEYLNDLLDKIVNDKSIDIDFNFS